MKNITFEIQQLRNESKEDLADYVERLRAENEALTQWVAELEQTCKLLALKLASKPSDYSQAAKGE